MSTRRAIRGALATVAAGALPALAGCGSSHPTGAQVSSSTSIPAYVKEPFTAHQKMVAEGARLIVADGCSVCHLPGASGADGPDFTSFAGRQVALADGRRTVVDERFLAQSLLDPRKTELKGYDPAPMLRALKRLHLAREERQVAALAAFIEQIGPETEPE